MKQNYVLKSVSWREKEYGVLQEEEEYKWGSYILLSSPQIRYNGI